MRSLALLFCATITLSAQWTLSDWQLRPRFAPPHVPADNPMSAAKVELGRHLFYDPRLSINLQQSCASCHRQELAFTDALPRSKGSTGALQPRSSMTLVNIAYAPSLTWANPNLNDLAHQALIPLLATDPVELGMHGNTDLLLTRLQQDPVYQRLFPCAFPDSPAPFSLDHVAKSLAAFQRTIISTRSPYDRYRYDHQPDAISESAKRGEKLFFSGEKAGCFQCHGGWNFSGPLRHANAPDTPPEFHNTGLYTLYASPNTGIQTHTHLPQDNGKFKAPTLRNIALTAPYMHDGSIPTLEGVLDHYSRGGRATNSPHRSPILRPFPLSPQERADLIEFLRSLTDADLLHDPRWSNPWTSPASSRNPQNKP